ncbi:hypothetical protein EV421DRAFT_1805707 [Armillaria borealis]|uniref:Uncharacterized protein n=1 Tax=Armillaria borealis TaxID=47425 RepID=A0AA39JJV1_9AGAR|nr:hypothetical protein EV421DRAFT_1805707 [Armillaria borealis]
MLLATTSLWRSKYLRDAWSIPGMSVSLGLTVFVCIALSGPLLAGTSQSPSQHSLKYVQFARTLVELARLSL